MLNAFFKEKLKNAYAQVKKPKVLKFLPLEESLKNPEMLFTDFAKFESPDLIHHCFQILHR